MPVLVTQGGATDDYVHPSFARPIASRKQRSAEGDWLEPDLDSLIAGMEEMAERRTGCDAATAVPWIVENFSWAKAVEKLVAVFRT